MLYYDLWVKNAETWNRFVKFFIPEYADYLNKKDPVSDDLVNRKINEKITKHNPKDLIRLLNKSGINATGINYCVVTMGRYGMPNCNDHIYSNKGELYVCTTDGDGLSLVHASGIFAPLEWSQEDYRNIILMQHKAQNKWIDTEIDFVNKHNFLSDKEAATFMTDHAIPGYDVTETDNRALQKYFRSVRDYLDTYNYAPKDNKALQAEFDIIIGDYVKNVNSD